MTASARASTEPGVLGAASAARGDLRPITPVAIAAAAVADAEDAVRDGEPARALHRLAGARALLGGMDPYLSAASTPASPDLAALDAATVAFDDPDLAGSDAPGLEPEMLSGHVEGRLLALLCRLVGARRALDVGMFTGYSALSMAEALPDDGEVVALEVDERVASFARRHLDRAGAGGRIRVVVGDAVASLRNLAEDGTPFDVVFLDADKPSYAQHLALLLDHGLVRPNGLVVADNTLLQGQPWLPDERRGDNGRAIAAFNAAVVDDPRLEVVMLPLRDGVSLMRVREDHEHPTHDPSP